MFLLQQASLPADNKRIHSFFCRPFKLDKIVARNRNRSDKDWRRDNLASSFIQGACFRMYWNGQFNGSISIHSMQTIFLKSLYCCHLEIQQTNFFHLYLYQGQISTVVNGCFREYLARLVIWEHGMINPNFILNDIWVLSSVMVLFHNHWLVMVQLCDFQSTKSMWK